ncbi:hypothetical protein AXI76_gp097 [Pseudoalteromonas phage H101]|uniref:Uncharacterized protein n=1 Tax=Pseudoalteromonas phage H101 TaxID=1654919 RepID=A0A0H4IRT5_9CAUD|nr:hypothetical protein AXI76_gp097 [Pseudoalteromonas phage H101]AKO60998.1 hypothetical protein [Pseudoalteromonas phage H101]
MKTHQINKTHLQSELVKVSEGQYKYGQFEIFKYENAQGQIRWCAELDGTEVREDFSQLKLLARELDSL